MPCTFKGTYTSECQFDVPDEELIQDNKETWCEFHLPLKDKSGWDAVRTKQFNERILTLIKSASEGACDLTGIVFPGSVDFSKCNFEKVSFDNAQFRGYAAFDNVQFGGLTAFSNAQFYNVAQFSNAEFRSATTFNSARFREDAWFNANTFDMITFEGAA